MDIITFSSQLQDRMRAELAEINKEPNEILKSSASVKAIHTIIGELKEFCNSYRFKAAEEEIKFFKETKPVFLSHYFYHQKIFSIKLYESFHDDNNRMAFYQKLLLKLRNFASKNEAFYQYCLSNATFLDQQYFTRAFQGITDINSNDKFYTAYDRKLAKVLCNELLKEYLQNAMKAMLPDGKATESQLTWTGQKTAIIELIYALHAVGVFNNSSVEVKVIVAEFERLFKINLGNFYRAYHEFGIRKAGRTIFLDLLKEKLIIKMDSLDE